MDRTEASDAFNAGSIPVSRSFYKIPYFQRKPLETLKIRDFSCSFEIFCIGIETKNINFLKKWTRSGHENGQVSQGAARGLTGALHEVIIPLFESQ